VDREQILEVVVEQVNDFAGRDYAPADIDRSRSIMEYGVDSLNMLQVLAEVEEALGIEIDLGSLNESDFASVDSLLDFLGSLRETARGST
jgi:acyl carrier protein